jgi:hypothetical protein
LMGSRVESPNQAVSSYGATACNLYSPTSSSASVSASASSSSSSVSASASAPNGVGSLVPWAALGFFVLGQAPQRAGFCAREGGGRAAAVKRRLRRLREEVAARPRRPRSATRAVGAIEAAIVGPRRRGVGARFKMRGCESRKRFVFLLLEKGVGLLFASGGVALARSWRHLESC